MKYIQFVPFQISFVFQEDKMGSVCCQNKPQAQQQQQKAQIQKQMEHNVLLK